MYWFVFIVLFCAAYYFYTFKSLQRKKEEASRFQEAHPDAARVSLQGGLKGISYERMMVLSVNDEPPNFFYDGLKQGLFLLPGKNVVEVTFSWNRPGVLNKNVTTTYEASKQEVEVEAGKNYRLGFDRDAEAYVFEEVS